MAWRQRKARVAREQDPHLLTVALCLLLFDRAKLVEELGKDAADAPHVDRLVVPLVEDADLRGSVPARLDMVGKLAVLSF